MYFFQRPLHLLDENLLLPLGRQRFHMGFHRVERRVGLFGDRVDPLEVVYQAREAPRVDRFPEYERGTELYQHDGITVDNDIPRLPVLGQSLSRRRPCGSQQEYRDEYRFLHTRFPNNSYLCKGN